MSAPKSGVRVADGIANGRTWRKQDVDLAALRALVDRLFVRSDVSVTRAAHGTSTQV